MSLVDEAFESLFYGAGAWLGLILFIALILGIVIKWKYSGALLLPVSVFLGIEYSNHGLMWHSVVIFLLAPFILMYMTYELRRGR